MKRRDFLKAGGGAILGAPFIFSKNKLFAQTTSRIIIAKHSGAATHSEASPFNLVPVTGIVNSMVDKMILLLTGKAAVGEAWESLFPAGSLSTNTKIAIKVNHSFDFYQMYNANAAARMCPWGQKAVVSEAIISGLTQMLGGMFPIENITVFDKHVDAYGARNNYAYSAALGMVHQGYPASQIDPKTKGYNVTGPELYNATLVYYRDPAVLAGMPTFQSGIARDQNGNTVDPIQTVFPPLANSDFLINIGTPKDHNMAGYTGVVKNLFGCANHCEYSHPSNPPANLIHQCLLEFYTHLTAITPCILNVLDGLAGVYDGGPVSGSPFYQNVIAGSIDPLPIESYGLELVNDARKEAQNLSPISILPGINANLHANAYFMLLAQDPGRYNLGSINPGHRTTVDLETGTVGITPMPSLDVPHGRVNLVARSGAGWRLSVSLDRSGRNHVIESTVFDAHGRVVRSLNGVRTPLSSADLWWDGKNSRGVTVTPGVYTWQVRINGRASHQSLFVS